MSLLAPLYVLGALGIGLPILFHLIRRQPRGRVVFSSLMFLKATPPTLTRRSRLDNWPLLLIRALALMLLAAAFARPFLRSPVLENDEASGRRIVLMIDTSASMRRDGLWQQAIDEATRVLDSLKPSDELAIVAFDASTRLAMTFDESASLQRQARRSLAQQTIRQLNPTWSASQLGQSLVFAAELLARTESAAGTDGVQLAEQANGHLILISDMQSGGDTNLAAVQSYQWPESIKLEIHSLAAQKSTNAWATVLEQHEDDNDLSVEKSDMKTEVANKTRVRVSSAANSSASDFTLMWASAIGQPIESTRTSVNVGPGESRIVNLTDPPESMSDTTTSRLMLTGDDHDFDNDRFVTRPKPMPRQLLFIGDSFDEPRESLLYYLQRAPLDNRQRTVTLQQSDAQALVSPPNKDLTPLVIVASRVDDTGAAALRKYVQSGGNVLWVLDGNTDLAAAQASLRIVGGVADLRLSESKVNDYVMWSKIDFANPLLRAFADVKYNDFTKIRYWSHRNIEGLPDSWNVLARFDDGNVAWTESTDTDGHLWVMTAGWQPKESQLALSTKFVPLVFGMLGQSDADFALQSLVVGDGIKHETSAGTTLELPDATVVKFEDKSGEFVASTPGFYQLVEGERKRTFAVNVAEFESRTSPLPLDELERYGVALGTIDESPVAAEQQRQRRDVELESRQRLWQWLLCGVLLLLGLESWLGGFLNRRHSAVS